MEPRIGEVVLGDEDRPIGYRRPEHPLAKPELEVPEDVAVALVADPRVVCPADDPGRGVDEVE